MSEENVEVVRRAFEASKRRDNDEVFPLYDPEVEIESGYDGRVYRGPGGVRAFFRDWLEVWDEIDWEAEEWIDGGDRVIALLHVSGRGKLRGVPVERSEAHLWTLRDGKLWRLGALDHPRRQGAKDRVLPPSRGRKGICRDARVGDVAGGRAGP